MEEKIKYKYLICIPALFIIGCVLLLWGISMTSEGFGNRKNLKKALNESSFDLNAILEGKYIFLSDYNVYGANDKFSNGVFSPACHVFITTKENLYYVAEIVAAILLIVGSRPWKIIQKIEMPLQKSFQYIYEKEYDDRDLRIIGEEAHGLRVNIRCLEQQYSIIRKAAFRNSIWGLIFTFVWFSAPADIEIYIFCFIFIIKMLFLKL